jgi:hypothetical protein
MSHCPEVCDRSDRPADITLLLLSWGFTSELAAGWIKTQNFSLFCGWIIPQLTFWMESVACNGFLCVCELC